jgi:hypothetical protein
VSNPYEPPQSTAGESAPREPPERITSDARLAALLMRLLGIYFTVGAIVVASEAAIGFVQVSSIIGLEQALTGAFALYARLGGALVQLIIGLYLAIGGRWVLDKILTPVVRRWSDDDDEDEDAAEDEPGTSSSQTGDAQ